MIMDKQLDLKIKSLIKHKNEMLYILENMSDALDGDTLCDLIHNINKTDKTIKHLKEKLNVA